MNFQHIGKLIILGGAAMVAVGILVYFADKIPFIGKLPGDIFIKRKNLTIYFPLATSILLSILLTVILYIFRK
ncbi:MAG: DUF2905 domain-containing protein [Bacteroidota bacterium]